MESLKTLLFISLVPFVLSADSSQHVILSRQQFKELCESAVVVYVIGVDTLMMPSSILDKIEADTVFFPNNGSKIKAFAQQLQEITPARLTDKIFAEILRIANEAYYAFRVPGKRTEDYIRSFIETFEDVASWWFVLSMSLRKAVERSVPLTTRSKETPEVAKEVCQTIPIPEDFNLGNPMEWINTTEWLSEQFVSAINKTQGFFTNYDNIPSIELPFNP